MNEATAQSPVAFVTGGSRGIGKACAVALAGVGFDVVIAARTVHAGEAHEHSVKPNQSDVSSLPGSLDETAALIEGAGQRSMAVRMDLLDRQSVKAGMGVVLETWGRVDLLLHNGRYIGPGQFESLLDTPVEELERFLEAHVIAQLILTQLALPGMLERGGGTIMTMTSGSAYRDVPFPPGQGGWGLSYSVGKAAGHRLVPHVKTEYGEAGIRSFNVNPGRVITERNANLDDGFEIELPRAEWAPPEAIGAVVAWLATSPEALAHDGTNVAAQPLCRELGLYPAWE